MATYIFHMHTVSSAPHLSDINIHVMSHKLYAVRSRWQVQFKLRSTPGPLAGCSNEALVVVQSSPEPVEVRGRSKGCSHGCEGISSLPGVPQRQWQTHTQRAYVLQLVAEGKRDDRLLQSQANLVICWSSSFPQKLLFSTKQLLLQINLHVRKLVT